MPIEIYNAGKYYGDFKALDNVNINVQAGTIHGLIGINGSGKTTLIKALVGIHHIDEGEIKILGEPVYENVNIKSKIGYVADRNRFFKSYTIDALIKFYKGMYPSFMETKFDEYNHKMKLNKKKRVNALSKGMQMRLSVMLNLARNPEVLILDEPTSGLDVVAKRDILNFIIQDVEERGMSVLISSHHLAELEMLCDEITMLSSGKMLYQSTVTDIKEKIKKMQVVFKIPLKEGTINELRQLDIILDVSNIGSVYYIVTNNIEQAIEKLKGLDVVLIENIPMSIEEIFIYTNLDKEWEHEDINKI
ncbi:MAG: ABC transporter [Epulopiscium sp. Nuni2H_MBin003]|nr:MAG: ABC transporter [Epulopiscium sp. Nuni2H_MBin003]